SRPARAERADGVGVCEGYRAKRGVAHCASGDGRCARSTGVGGAGILRAASVFVYVVVAGLGPRTHTWVAIVSQLLILDCSMFRKYRLYALIAAGTLFAPPALAQETIKIGASQPLTGPVAAAGTYVANGARLAAEQLNAQGGVLGKKIELIVEDNKSNP